MLSNHTNFVSAVCVLNEGKWLATASNDKTICLYLFGIVQPFATLTDHTNTVCTLSQGLESKILFSGSWDQTARIWNNLDVNSTSIELKGHEAAVWAVCALKTGKYATGSADKNIFIWNPKGEKLVVLKGHTDCVRGLVGLEDGSLLSASNDATIRHWSDTYDCLREFHGHSNYIYSIALNPALGDVFVTGSEDNTIRLWSVSKGALGDALAVPAQSVWSVSCMDNSDIIVGSSDALIRVFTKDPTRTASDDLLAAYETAVATRKMEQSKELGGVKVNDLPGPESLLQEGTEEGQTRLVRQPNGKILCYQWTSGKWECVGDVMGAAGGTQETSGKTLHEGIEYDYVFNVDIEDGKPPIKLPYNRSEDPWAAAQKFIHKNDLPQVYLEQVANFIITNSDQVAMPTVQAEFADPFTGGGRYVPQSNGSTSSNTSGVNVNFRERSGMVNVDPFTGGSSYSSTKDLIVKKHSPYLTYTSFDICDASKVLIKLKEFNNQLTEELSKVNEADLEKVITLIPTQNASNDIGIECLKKIMHWPAEKLFPVLDVIRLAVRNPEFSTKLGGFELLEFFAQRIPTVPANQLMSVRALCNLMTHKTGRELVELKVHEFINLISKIKQGNANLQSAIATFYLNQSITQHEQPAEDITRLFCLEIVNFLEWTNDPESTFRAYQALGNLFVFNSNVTAPILKTAEVLKNGIKRNRSSTHEKLAEISMELGDKLMI